MAALVGVDDGDDPLPRKMAFTEKPCAPLVAAIRAASILVGPRLDAAATRARAAADLAGVLDSALLPLWSRVAARFEGC